ncbi:hypothetical protein Hanom_Chr01g00029071 [Helianthus anomalus]
MKAVCPIMTETRFKTLEDIESLTVIVFWFCASETTGAFVNGVAMSGWDNKCPIPVQVVVRKLGFLLLVCLNV